MCSYYQKARVAIVNKMSQGQEAVLVIVKRGSAVVENVMRSVAPEKHLKRKERGYRIEERGMLAVEAG